MPDEIAQEYVQKSIQDIIDRVENPKEHEPIFDVTGLNLDILNGQTAMREAPEQFKKKQFAPGFFETVGGHALEHQEFVQLGRKLLKTISAPVFPEEEIPEDWSVFKTENIIDLDNKYWSYILESKSPKELQFRREQAFGEMQKNERLSQGGFIASLAGGAGGIITSPTTYILPTIAAAKYAKASQHIVGAALEIAPSLALNTFAHEAIVQGGHVQGDYEEWALNSARDTAFGLAFYGAGRALGFGATSNDVWSSRKIVNITYDGIDVVRKVGPKGELEGLVAQAREGMNVGAKEVSSAQKFLDNRAVSNGLITEGLLRLGSVPILGSPLLRGLRSKFSTVSHFYNFLGNESVVTGAIERGLPRQTTAAEVRRLITNKARQAAFEIDDLYVESLGIKPGALGSAKAVIKQWQEGLSASRSEFNSAVMNTAITGEQSLSKQVNEAAAKWTDISDDIWKAYLESKGYSPDILPPRNAKGYMTQMHDLTEMARDPKKFVDTVVNALEVQDKQKLAYLEPLKTAQEQLASLNQELKVKGIDEKAVNKKIRDTRKTIAQLEDSLHNDMRNGKIDPALLEERVLLNEVETKELEAHLKPINDLKTKVKDATQELESLSRNEQKASRSKIQKLQQQIESLEADLRTKALSGTINSKLFREVNGRITFLDPFELPKFSEIYRDNFARSSAAEAYYDTIMNLNSDQISNQILDRLTGATDPNVTKRRTLLIPQKDLLDNGLLVTDISKVLGLYSNSLGKRIALNTVFKDMNLDEGIKTLSQNLTLEYQKAVNTITNKLERSPKRDKMLDKLLKDKDEAVSQISDAYNYFMGNTNASKGAQRFGRVARNLGAINMLRNVPLLMGGEIGGIVLKQRLWPTITGGLIPFVQRVNSKAARMRYNKNWKHARVGLEMEVNKWSNAIYEPTTSNGITGNFIEVAGEKGAKLAQTLFLTNDIVNGMQKFSSSVTQSRVIGDMYDMAAGKLSRADQRRLLMNGINPADHAKWIKAFETGTGYKSNTGGYVSNWFEWKDLDLVSQMRKAIYNDIQGGILEAGVLDKPFWTKDPVLGLPFQFMGYLYAAFNKFTIPLAQTPDPSKFLGLAMIIAYGSLVETLRKWEKGEPFEIDSDKALDQWFVQGMAESGALGWPVAVYENLDALLDPPFLDRYRQDKFKRRSWVGIWGGPFGGVMQNIFDVATMFIHGKINKKDLMKLRGISTIPIPIWADWALTRGIRATDFPETRKDADYYSFIDRD